MRLIILLIFLVNVTYAVPFVTDEMLNAQFWIKRTKHPDTIIMDKKKIEAFNKKIEDERDYIVDIFNYPENLPKDELLKFLNVYKIPEEGGRFDTKNQKLSKSYWNKIKDNLNLDEVKANNPVKYAISVEKIQLRGFPTSDIVWAEENDLEFDSFQETDADVLTPMVVLHESADKNWYLVQLREYLGWTRKEGIAFAKNRDELKVFERPEKFLVVTGSHVVSGTIPVTMGEVYKTYSFMMGTKIPLVDEIVERQESQNNYTVKLPVRKEDGMLDSINAYISKSADVSIGLLPYTKRTILKQIFKMLGERYGWGGSNEGRDCSRLILDTFRTVGIYLPRNSFEQRTVGLEKFNFEKEIVSEKEKLKFYKKLAPGVALFKPGHVALYLGTYNNRPYIIHAISKFYDHTKNEKYPVMSAVVSDLSIFEKGIDQMVWAREFID
ncbi:MAG: SH3 domain-containing protein [Bacteriovoracaceae bacterium]